MLQLKIRSLGGKECYEVLKSKSPCFMLNKNVNFNKNKTEYKLEDLTYACRDTNLLLQLILELRIKNEIDQLELVKENNVTSLQHVFCILGIFKASLFYVFQ